MNRYLTEFPDNDMKELAEELPPANQRVLLFTPDGAEYDEDTTLKKMWDKLRKGFFIGKVDSMGNVKSRFGNPMYATHWAKLPVVEPTEEVVSS
ncbi:hypothetical protein [Salinibacter phage M8CRM-1]|uniref:DUF551 domain-containing protein n=1 Tax=Salinibacter phage M8CRM-1 TaxID=2681612 RepID=A0A2I6UGR3_9CAUD|nr:hypothetical protein FGG67_gp42 [Salinibacter phage M8CRM-1]AUO79162.1 hypothetical protein [Salinibacter phage M8CRM-1]